MPRMIPPSISTLTARLHFSTNAKWVMFTAIVTPPVIGISA
jgi:hypothetical protein